MVVKIWWEKGAKGDWLYNERKYEFCVCDVCNLDIYSYQIKITFLLAASFYLCLFRLSSFFLFFFSLILSYTIVFFSTLPILLTNPSLRERWMYIRIRINEKKSWQTCNQKYLREHGQDRWILKHANHTTIKLLIRPFVIESIQAIKKPILINF